MVYFLYLWVVFCYIYVPNLQKPFFRQPDRRLSCGPFFRFFNIFLSSGLRKPRLIELPQALATSKGQTSPLSFSLPRTSPASFLTFLSLTFNSSKTSNAEFRQPKVRYRYPVSFSFLNLLYIIICLE